MPSSLPSNQPLNPFILFYLSSNTHTEITLMLFQGLTLCGPYNNWPSAMLWQQTHTGVLILAMWGPQKLTDPCGVPGRSVPPQTSEDVPIFFFLLSHKAAETGGMNYEHMRQGAQMALASSPLQICTMPMMMMRPRASSLPAVNMSCTLVAHLTLEQFTHVSSTGNAKRE